MNIHLPRILITAPASGSGKTLFSCALMKAFLNHDLKISAAKCGPDYIDPLFHRQVLGIPSQNLDSFFFNRETLCEILLNDTDIDTDLTIIEGVMGYYDGLGGFNTAASTYDISVKTQTPAILLLPCQGMSLTAAAILKGLLSYKKDSMIQGVVFNQISQKIYGQLKDTIESDPDIPVRVLGYLPKLPNISLKSRHLGLILPEECQHLERQLQSAADQLTETVDLNGILSIAKTAPVLNICLSSLSSAQAPPFSKPVRIAVALDKAFCFYYKETLSILETLGAELVFFSPCCDHCLPEGINGLYFGGGYPELYAAELSANCDLRREIKEKIDDGKGIPCIAECGGFLYLHETLEDQKGSLFPMCGVIKGRCFPKGRLGNFGYITLIPQKEIPFLTHTTVLRAHEFHYWESSHPGNAFLAQKPYGNHSWECMHSKGNLLAGFPHIAFASVIELLVKYLQIARTYQ